MSQYRVLKGRLGEEASTAYLKEQGYRILERNWRSGRRGEIDIIAVSPDEKTLVFVEVKTRSSNEHGHPAEAVTSQKQQQLFGLAEQYIQSLESGFDSVRFDILSVLHASSDATPQIEHLVNAFSS